MSKIFKINGKILYVNSKIMSDFESTVIPESLVYVTNPGADTDIKPNLQTAINSAVDGDIVVLPSGTFKYLGTISTTKKISLRGAGKTSTILYRPESITPSTLSNMSFITFNINDTDPCGIVISDFTIKSQIPYGRPGYTGSEAEDCGILIVQAIDVIVTRVQFENFGFYALGIHHLYNNASGLVYNCDFIHNYKGTTGLGLGYGVAVQGTASWLDTVSFGSSNFIFIEDCYFEGQRHDVAGEGSGLYVFRYNEIYNHLLQYGAVDTHDARGTGDTNDYYATRAMECYENYIHNDRDYNGDLLPTSAPYYENLLVENAIETRGGACLVHNNTIEGFHIAAKVNAIWHAETGDTEFEYPISGQHGYGSGISQGGSHTGTDATYGKDDYFFWNNTFVQFGDTTTQILFWSTDYDEYYMKADRDWHLSAPTFSYTPYTYPHPLRG